MSEPLRKRRFGLSLRALMVIVLLLSVGLAWKANRARTMREAIAVIKAGDGHVLYDCQFAGVMVDSLPKVDLKGEPKVPGWLRQAAGDDLFQDVTSISFGGDNPSPKVWEAVSKLDHLISLKFHILDAKMERVSGLRSLERLKHVAIGYQMKIDESSLDEFGAIPNLESFIANIWLSPTEFGRVTQAQNLVEIDATVTKGDESVAPLAKLSHLKSIKLKSQSLFSDSSIHHLAPILPNLESLSLNPGMIGDEGLAELTASRHLKKLELGTGMVGPAGARGLGKLESLESLNLSNIGIDDEGLAELRGLKNLKKLFVTGSKITDVGLSSLAELPNLKVLNLMYAQITDAGLVHVRKMKSLEQLTLSQMATPLGQESVEALKVDRPKLILITPGSKFILRSSPK